jgi:hypothetical protein
MAGMVASLPDAREARQPRLAHDRCVQPIGQQLVSRMKCEHVAAGVFEDLADHCVHDAF